MHAICNHGIHINGITNMSNYSLLFLHLTCSISAYVPSILDLHSWLGSLLPPSIILRPSKIQFYLPTRTSLGWDKTGVLGSSTCNHRKDMETPHKQQLATIESGTLEAYIFTKRNCAKCCVVQLKVQANHELS